MPLTKHDIIGARVKNVFQTPPVTTDGITVTLMYVEFDDGTLIYLDPSEYTDEIIKSANRAELTLITADLDGEPSCVGEEVLDIVLLDAFMGVLLSSGRCLRSVYAFGSDSWFVEIYEPRNERDEIRSYQQGLSSDEWPIVDLATLESKFNRVQPTPRPRAPIQSENLFLRSFNSDSVIFERIAIVVFLVLLPSVIYAILFLKRGWFP